MPLTDVATAMAAAVRAGSPEEITVSRVTIDSRDTGPDDLFFAIRGERYDGHTFLPEALSRGAAAAVCDRTWFDGQSVPVTVPPVPLLIVDDTIEALGRLAAHHRRHVMPVSTVVVGITGTNGKTTTRCMIDHVLAPSFPGRAAPRNYNNHIGAPLTLLSAEADDRYLAVEIGTNAPGEVAALAKMTAPHAVVITSIGEGHLEGLGRIEDVAEEKASLLKHVRSDGLAVVQIDRPEINPFLKLAPARTITVGSSPGARLCVCDVVGDMHGIAFTLDGRFRVALSMPGLHHATNAAAAFAVARWFGLDPQRILRRLRSFVPPEGRTRVHDLGPVTLIDDAYNANPPGMLAAITALGRGATGRRILVMGDMLELGHAAPDLHRDVVRAVAASGIEVFVPVGPATVLAAREALGGSADVMIEPCDDASQACERLRTLVKPHDTIWIKGSRAMGLDAVVCDLREGLGSGAAVAQGSST